MNDSEEWLLTCLARYLLRMTLADRRAFLARWRQNHGKESEAKVRVAVKHEWEQRNG